MIEVLLRAAKWQRIELERALSVAMHNGRIDVVDLLLENGAPIGSIDFRDVCKTVKPELMKRFLRAGVDPTYENGFARALDELKARPLLRFYKEMRDEYPSLDAQAALALRAAVSEGKVRWVALLRWAGADPFRRVSDDLYVELDERDENQGSTAARTACFAEDPTIIKVLKLRPTPEQARELLSAACHADRPEILEVCLKAIPECELNATENGGCEALQNLVARRPWSFPWGRLSNEQREAGVVASIEVLLNAGAKWRPPPSELRYARRGLIEHDGRYVVRVVRLLRYTPDCCALDDLRELCRTPAMREKIVRADQPLWAELHEKPSIGV